MGLSGQCYCGAVKIEITGDPAVCFICHCKACVSWGGGIGNAGTLVPADKVKITGELVEANPPNFCGGYDETKGVMPQGFSKRKSCAKCYGCVLNDHAHTDAKMVDICGGLIDWGEKGFQPAMHINYANAMFKLKDGKPKFKDFPTEFGGTGEIIPAASSMWGVWDKE